MFDVVYVVTPPPAKSHDELVSFSRKMETNPGAIARFGKWGDGDHAMRDALARKAFEQDIVFRVQSGRRRKMHQGAPATSSVIRTRSLSTLLRRFQDRHAFRSDEVFFLANRLDLVSLAGDGPGNEDHAAFMARETVAAGNNFLDRDFEPLQAKFPCRASRVSFRCLLSCIRYPWPLAKH